MASIEMKNIVKQYGDGFQAVTTSAWTSPTAS